MAIISFTMISFLCSLLLVIFFTSQLANADNNTQNFHYFCNFHKTGTYTPNSTYHTNLSTLLSNLTSNTEINYGFHNFSQGENTNKVNVIGLCRGDVRPSDCLSCFKGSRANLTQLCPNQKEAIGWFEDERCMLRYSDRSIFGVMEDGPAYYAKNMKNASDLGRFEQAVTILLYNLTSIAASGDSRHKYATESAPAPYDKILYGLAQCMPDLSESDCSYCLVQSFKSILIDCCLDKIGGRVVRPSCYMRFETSSQFYETIAWPPPPPATTTTTTTDNTSSSGKSKSTTGITIAIPVVVVVVMVLIFICIYLRVRKPRKKFQIQEDEDEDKDDEIEIFESL